MAIEREIFEYIKPVRQMLYARALHSMLGYGDYTAMLIKQHVGTEFLQQQIEQMKLNFPAVARLTMGCSEEEICKAVHCRSTRKLIIIKYLELHQPNKLIELQKYSAIENSLTRKLPSRLFNDNLLNIQEWIELQSSPLLRVFYPDLFVRLESSFNEHLYKSFKLFLNDWKEIIHICGEDGYHTRYIFPLLNSQMVHLYKHLNFEVRDLEHNICSYQMYPYDINCNHLYGGKIGKIFTSTNEMINVIREYGFKPAEILMAKRLNCYATEIGLIKNTEVATLRNEYGKEYFCAEDFIKSYLDKVKTEAIADAQNLQSAMSVDQSTQTEKTDFKRAVSLAKGRNGSGKNRLGVIVDRLTLFSTKSKPAQANANDERNTSLILDVREHASPKFTS